MKLIFEQGTVGFKDGAKLTIELPNSDVDLPQILEEAIIPALNWHFGWDVKKQAYAWLDEQLDRLEEGEE